MRWVWNVIAVLLILAGGTFTLQGLNVLLGSFMSGSPQWLVIGVVMVLVGVAVLIVANRRPRPT
jgi:hypothetical protein